MSFKYTPTALKKIEQIYDEAKYLVRYEKGNFASGYCVLEHKKVVVVNKFLNVEGRINALLEILPSIKVDPETFSGESLKLLDQLNIQIQTAPLIETRTENLNEADTASPENPQEPGTQANEPDNIV
ncbi:MAG: hypothetical protein JNM21_15650 [Taibaiella sp.]|nr:hypothetical protein [Taibaiella sp.]